MFKPVTGEFAQIEDENLKSRMWIVFAMVVSIAAFAAVACSSEPEAATPGPTIAPRAGAIEGIVTGPDGKPLAGMRVGIESGTVPAPEIAPETDVQGRYRLGSVPPGVFNVAVHDRDGNRVGLESVEVKSEETSTLDFSISAQSASASTLTTGAVAVDFETCEGFLDEPPPNMVSSTIEATESGQGDNPNIVSICVVSHQTLDRSRALTLTVIKFDSIGAAESNFELLRDSFSGDVTEGEVGPNSITAVVNSAGLGSFVVIQNGVHLINLHTAMPEGETPVRNVDELASLAQMVNSKLP